MTKKVDIDDFGNERESRRGERAGEESELSHFYHLCFLLPPSSSHQLLSTASSLSFPPFILCPITSNNFQYSHSLAEHRKEEKENMVITFQLFQCHHCHA
ncbi:hypothetical protein llap_5757 [Limosa lapponica baueri]|uniref:Uncharacterized protein n=1 Tax=Limosa lapponica baueri TaxID=1758121 RepID=A0A2I0UD29_LIMLA|nr:hypothetical protein llap_5757 [Limosa lapponica baueri]